RAIEQTVKLGDVVLDIGTGTGILAIGAAKAGAKHVYAIESSALADVARRMVEDNGMTAAVTVIQGWSHEVELPQKANVLVSETVGDGAMGERILESVLDARRRLLTPDAKIIPRSIKVGVAAVSLTPALLDHYTFSADNVAKWNADYEMDFKSLKDIEPDPDRLTPYRMRTRDYSSCTPLGKPLWLATVELASFAEPLLHSSATLEVNRDGYLHGLVLFFELELSGGEKLSTAPAGTPGSAISSDCHWRIPLWLRAQPLKVTAGDDFQITFDYSLGISRLRMRSAPPSLNV
ncbi:MAG TPA: 50S ribosomal protein L11 methyltransferase, partial [Terriglobales bacterium]|nr:50S ribosomal protein L11 methyltransferase [Terriglobales bacterium]